MQTVLARLESKASNQIGKPSETIQNLSGLGASSTPLSSMRGAGGGTIAAREWLCWALRSANDRPVRVLIEPPQNSTWSGFISSQKSLFFKDNEPGSTGEGASLDLLLGRSLTFELTEGPTGVGRVEGHVDAGLKIRVVSPINWDPPSAPQCLAALSSSFRIHLVRLLLCFLALSDLLAADAADFTAAAPCFLKLAISNSK